MEKLPIEQMNCLVKQNLNHLSGDLQKLEFAIAHKTIAPDQSQGKFE